MSALRALCKVLFLLPLAFYHPAHAAEKMIGTTCKNDQNAADWDTIARCNSGTFTRAPYWFGASGDICDSSHGGQVQWTGSALQYCDGTAWTAFGSGGSVAARNFSIAGDATAAAVSFDGSADVTLATSVVKLQGRAISSTAPTAGQALVWNGTTNLWEPGTVSSATGSGQSIAAGWPDVIVCYLTSNGDGPYVFYLDSISSGYAQYLKSYQAPVMGILFRSNGSFYLGMNITGYDCNTNGWSISQLIANGHAFNIVNGGSSAGAMLDGTAGAPGLYFANDANTGFYRPTADTLSVATAGAERLRVDAVGNVGIGTTNPNAGAILDLSGANDTVRSSLLLPQGATGTRPSPGTLGMIRYNTTLGQFEGYGASGWGTIGGTTTPTARNFSITGDATAAAVSFNGTADVALSATVAKLQGRAVSTTAPTAGQTLTWNATTSQWEPQTPSASGDSVIFW